MRACIYGHFFIYIYILNNNTEKRHRWLKQEVNVFLTIFIIITWYKIFFREFVVEIMRAVSNLIQKNNRQSVFSTKKKNRTIGFSLKYKIRLKILYVLKNKKICSLMNGCYYFATCAEFVKKHFSNNTSSSILLTKS